MICIKCNQDMLRCNCDDAEVRILDILKSPYLAFGQDYAQALVARIAKNRPDLLRIAPTQNGK